MEGKLANPKLTPTQWVQLYLEANNIKFSYKTNSYNQGDSPIEIGLLLSQMRLAAFESRPELKPMLPDALMVVRNNHNEKFLLSLRERLKFNAGDEDLVAQWVKACTGSDDAINVAVVRHWIWLVKRKLFGLKTEHEMMICLYGPGGIGKSQAVYSLLKPLDEVSFMADMRIFSDSFSKRRFTRNFTCFLDELGQSQNADIELLKQTITAPTVQWRGMHSENGCSGPNRTCFISCCNEPLSERIADNTGYRRYYQLTCGRMDWDVINGIDYVFMWQSVNENESSPILPFLPELKARQEQMRFKDTVEEFLTDTAIGGPVKATELYREYSQFLLNQQRRSEIVSITRFGRRLTDLGILRERQADGVYYKFPGEQRTVA